MIIFFAVILSLLALSWLFIIIGRYQIKRMTIQGERRVAEERVNPNSLLNWMEAYEKENLPEPIETKELHKKTFTFTKDGVYLSESFTQPPTV